MNPSLLDQLIINDSAGKSIKPKTLKAMVYQQGRSPKDVIALLDEIMTEASQALDQKSLDQKTFVELVSELEIVLKSYCEIQYKSFFYKLNELDKSVVGIKLSELHDFYCLESRDNLTDTLKKIEQIVQQKQPDLLNEWKDLSPVLLDGYHLMFKIFAGILNSTKINNTFDIKKLTELLKSLVQCEQWGIIKVFLDLEGKNFPLDIKINGVDLIEHAGSRLSNMSAIVTKYLVLLGCNIPKHFPYFINKRIGSLPSNLRDSYDCIMGPATPIPFFKNLPTEIKERIAVQTLRANDPDLSYIPYEGLIKGLYRKELHAYKAYDGQRRNKNNTFLLVVRKFREYCQQAMDNTVTVDKRDLLNRVAEKRLPDKHFTVGERKILENTFKETARAGKYLSKPDIKQTLDTYMAKLKNISTIVDEACLMYHEQTRKSINPLEKEDLMDKLTLAIAKHETNMQWDDTTIFGCAFVIADFLNEAANKPEPAATPGLFQNSSLTRKISADDVENAFVNYLALTAPEKSI